MRVRPCGFPTFEHPPAAGPSNLEQLQPRQRRANLSFAGAGEPPSDAGPARLGFTYGSHLSEQQLATPFLVEFSVAFKERVLASTRR